jgi:hypothetical protein
MAIFHFFSEGQVDLGVPHVHYLKFRMFLAQKEKIQGAQLKTVKMLFVFTLSSMMSFSFHICFDFYDTVMGFCLIPITIIMQMKAIRLIPLIFLYAPCIFWFK